MPASSRARRRARRNLSVFAIEQLEDRSLPSSSPAAALGSLSVDATRYVADHVIVALRPGTSLSGLSAVAPNLIQSTMTLDAAAGLVDVVLQPGITVAQGVAFFQAQSYVRYAQPDYYVSAAVTPNDPSFSSQWGQNNTGQTGGVADADVDAPEAWDITTGTGGTVVAIIDSGVDMTHPDLAANIWTNPGEIAGNGFDDDGNGYVDDIHGWNFVSNNNNPTDDNGHGSHVAGIIGAVGNNGIGVAGVDWNVKIMPVKFLDANGSGSLSNAVLALNYAYHNGASVSNNSWGGGGFYQPMFDAINAARATGHIFVAAAGNSSSNNDSIASYPSNYNLDNVVAVASTTATDGLSSFSNYGATTVDIGAPGSSIYSTYKNGGYATLSGTSMATPFVTGAIALVHDQHPTWVYSQIISQVLNNTDPVAALQGRTVTGGRLNLFKAVNSGAPAPDTSGPRVTTAVFSGAASTINNLRLTFSEAISPASFDAFDVAAFKRDGIDIPGLTYTITPVSGSANKQFDVTFAAQSIAGSYALTIGPDITDVAGNAMNQNGNAVNGENPGDQYTATGTISSVQTFNSTDAPKNLPDAATTTSVLSVGQNLTIGKITVKLNLNHTWDSDLRISLKSPAGTTVILSNRRGGSGDNYTNTVFDSSAATSITSGVAPFAGTYRPEQSLTAFNNQIASGTWSLIISDLAFADSGRLNSWSITITPAAGGAAMSDGSSAPGTLVGGASFKLQAPVQSGFGGLASTGTGSQGLATSSAAQQVQVDRQAAPSGMALQSFAAEAGFVVVPAGSAPAQDWLNFDASEPFGAWHGIRLS